MARCINQDYSNLKLIMSNFELAIKSEITVIGYFQIKNEHITNVLK